MPDLLYAKILEPYEFPLFSRFNFIHSCYIRFYFVRHFHLAFHILLSGITHLYLITTPKSTIKIYQAIRRKSTCIAWTNRELHTLQVTVSRKALMTLLSTSTLHLYISTNSAEFFFFFCVQLKWNTTIIACFNQKSNLYST